MAALKGSPILVSWYPAYKIGRTICFCCRFPLPFRRSLLFLFIPYFSPFPLPWSTLQSRNSAGDTNVRRGGHNKWNEALWSTELARTFGLGSYASLWKDTCHLQCCYSQLSNVPPMRYSLTTRHSSKTTCLWLSPDRERGPQNGKHTQTICRPGGWQKRGPAKYHGIFTV